MNEPPDILIDQIIENLVELEKQGLDYRLQTIYTRRKFTLGTGTEKGNEGE